jgi:hypothetical protein
MHCNLYEGFLLISWGPRLKRRYVTHFIIYRQFLSSVFDFCLHKNPGVRLVAYELLQDLYMLFKTSNEPLSITAICMMLACLGDQDLNW